MKTVKVEPNQTVYDLAAQHYGTTDGVSEILANNPDIENDPKALSAGGINTLQQNAFRLDVAVKVGATINIDEGSKTINRRIVKKIENPVTTYELWHEQ